MIGSSRYRPHWQPDAVVYSLEQFRDWMFTASPGERCIYHTGQMLIDQETRPFLKDLGNYAVLMADFGAVRIAQKRAGDGIFQYFASRTETGTGTLPRSVTLGEVNVRTYKVLAAIHNRETRVSARKAIRDAITSTEDEAVAIFDQLVASGVVNKGKPPGQGPYLEKIGLDALK